MTNLELGRKKWSEDSDNEIIRLHCPNECGGIDSCYDAGCRKCWEGEATEKEENK